MLKKTKFYNFNYGGRLELLLETMLRKIKTKEIDVWDQFREVVEDDDNN